MRLILQQVLIFSFQFSHIYFEFKKEEEWENVVAVSQNDVLEAIKSTKISSDEGIRKKYEDWQKSFGSV